MKLKVHKMFDTLKYSFFTASAGTLIEPNELSEPVAIQSMIPISLNSSLYRGDPLILDPFGAWFERTGTSPCFPLITHVTSSFTLIIFFNASSFEPCSANALVFPSFSPNPFSGHYRAQITPRTLLALQRVAFRQSDCIFRFIYNRNFSGRWWSHSHFRFFIGPVTLEAMIVTVFSTNYNWGETKANTINWNGDSQWPQIYTSSIKTHKWHNLLPIALIPE